MKCIILASGKGARMQPLTNTTPKPLLQIAGKSIIEHNMQHLVAGVDEFVFVVKHLGEQFSEYFGDNYQGIPVTYASQGVEPGTAAALWDLDADGDILIMYADSIFAPQDLQSILALDGYGCLVKQVDEPSKYGIFSQKEDGTASKIVEKPQEDIGNLASTGVFKFSAEILAFAQNVPVSSRGEYELTDAISMFCTLYPFMLIEMQGAFIDIGYPWQILDANTRFLAGLSESHLHGTVEENVTIKGNIILGEGAVLKSGTYIEGNCIIGAGTSIGPNAYLRGSTVIGKNCKIGNAVEIKNSSIGNNSMVKHLSYIGDSILGNEVVIGAGTIVANLRHDQKDMRCMIAGELVDTGIRKLGVIVGDRAKVGIKNSIYPARVIDTDGTTLPGEIVK